MNQKNRNTKKQPIPPQQKKNVRRAETGKIGSWVWITLAVVAVTTFIVYSKAVGFGYAWDDEFYILQNSHINNLKWENIRLFFTEFYVGNYQPVSILSYAIEQKILKGSWVLMHRDNILIHIINAYLVFVLIRKISPQNIMAALITAAFFAVHPMHVESVAWVSERKDVMYSFFFLLSLIIYTNYIKEQKTKQLIYTGVFFILSCLSKSAAVVLPLVMLLLDYYLNRKVSWKMTLEKIPFFVVSLAFGIVATHSQKDSIHGMAPEMSTIQHIPIVCFSFISYLFKAFIPAKLSAIYPYPIELGNTLPVLYYLSILVIGVLLFFVWYSRRWNKDVVFGFLFFIITIILVLQFIPVGAATMADRYTYIPYIGIFFIAGKLFERLSMQASSNINFKKYSLAGLGIIFFAFASISYGRVGVWENNETLFADVKDKYETTSIPYFATGDYYSSYFADNVYAGDILKRDIYREKAVLEYQGALKLATSKADSAKSYYNIGIQKMKTGKVIDAVSNFNAALQIDANYSDAYINRGSIKIDLKDYAGAMDDFNKVIEINRNHKNALGYYNRGVVKTALKDYGSAILDFDTAVSININYAAAYTNRGCSKFYMGDYNNALQDFNKALELNPQDANSIKNRDAIISILQNAKK